MVDPFVWQECGDRSHAIRLATSHSPLPGDTVHALCGQTFVLVRDDFRRNHPNRTTCSACIFAWQDYQESTCATATSS